MKKRVLIKVGGRAFEKENVFAGLAKTILENIENLALIIVHGGGAQISAALTKAGRPTEFIDGIRKTQKEDIEIIERILSQEVNGHIVAQLNRYGVSCQSLSGKSTHLMIAEPWRPKGKDVGFVGKIVKVQPSAVESAFMERKIPVVSPISADLDGNTYNINADDAAAALAIGMCCTDLVYFTDVLGVKDNKGQVISHLTISEANHWIEQGVIFNGMVAKVNSITDAILKGVERIHVTAWQKETTLSDILSDESSLIKTTFTR